MEDFCIVVGGQTFEIAKTLVDKGPPSKLQKLAKCEPIKRIERPPEVFSAILSLYQTGELHMPMTSCPAAFLRELEFWEIGTESIPLCCSQRIEHFLKDQALQISFLSAQSDDSVSCHVRHCSGLRKMVAGVWKVLDYKDSSFLSLLYFTITVVMVLMSIFVIAYSTDESFHRAMTNCERLDYMIRNNMENVENVEKDLLKHCDSLVVPFALFTSNTRNGNFEDNMDTDQTTLNYIIPIEDEIYPPSTPFSTFLEGETIKPFSFDQMAKAIDDLFAKEVDSLEASEKQSKSNNDSTDENMVLNGSAREGTNGGITIESITEFDTGSNVFGDSDTNRLRGLPNDDPEQLERFGLRGLPNDDPEELKNFDLRGLSNDDLEQLEENFKGSSTARTPDGKTDADNMGVFKRSTPSVRQIRDAHPDRIIVSAPTTHTLHNSDSGSDFKIVSIPNLNVKITVFVCLELTSLTFFSIDILLRLFCCSSIRKYFTSFINITDTIALVSAYVYMLCLYQVKVQRYQKSWIDFLWYVQLLRAFRLFRIMGHLRAGKVLQFVVLNNIRDFLIVAIFLVAGMCTFASVIYLAEGKDVVKDIPTGWYWAVVTMTTVGYGDIVPLTAVGRAISCVCALCGILMLAMTIPIVTENFIKLYRHASAKPASKDLVKKVKALKPKSVSLSISTDIDSRF